MTTLDDDTGTTTAPAGEERVVNPWAAWLARYDVQPYQLARKAGWDAFVAAGPREDFATLTRTQMDGLSADAREDYDEARMVWNANLPTIRTAQMASAFSLMGQVLASGRRDGDRLRGSVVIDAAPAWARRRSRPASRRTSTGPSTAGTGPPPPRATSGCRWRSSR
ncbi:hypothetical protein [Pseudokineococcus sp. 1T1Z-3]|uniref:hypothetical protein n=1 Tax=Pseudokineococcus sp. 1T1Z-3 TaxID=3132745 RepID=UPI0030A2AF80